MFLWDIADLHFFLTAHEILDFKPLLKVGVIWISDLFSITPSVTSFPAVIMQKSRLFIWEAEASACK